MFDKTVLADLRPLEHLGLNVFDLNTYKLLGQIERHPAAFGFSKAHWDQLLRLATSIRTGTTTSSAMLKKLSAYPRQNGLAKALREIGRIERTLFTLDWIKNPDLRRRAQLGLNKGEARNALARAVYFCRLGEMRDRSFENQFFRASGLNLLVAAIILWNTKYLEVAYRELRRQGRTINEDLLRHVAPLGWEHIGLTGDYVWSDCRPTAGRYAQPAAAAAIVAGGLSSLNVPDVVHSEHFRVVTPKGRNGKGWRRPIPGLSPLSPRAAHDVSRPSEPPSGRPHMTFGALKHVPRPSGGEVTPE